jgi:CDP-glycerol glycerophosphotransferase
MKVTTPFILTKKASIRLFQLPLYLFSCLFPKRKSLLLFSSWQGKFYRGNTRFLFEYVTKERSDLDAVWMCKTDELYNSLTAQGIKAARTYSLIGIYLTLRAKYYFVTHGILDMNEVFSGGGLLVNLDHATYPIKDTQLKIPRKLTELIAIALDSPFAYFRKSDYAITSSKLTANYTSYRYRIEKDQVFVTGLPKANILMELANRSRNDHKDQILFLPTWRRDPNFSVFNESFGFSKSRLVELLEKSNQKFHVNLHPSNINNNLVSSDEDSRLTTHKLNSSGVYEMFAKSAIFITDFSTSYADFLLFDQPMIFAMFNFDEYLQEKKLYLDVDTLPGAIVYNWDELIKEIDHINNYGERAEHLAKRVELKKNIYSEDLSECCRNILKHFSYS